MGSSWLKRSRNLDFNFLPCPTSWESSHAIPLKTSQNLQPKKGLTPTFLFLQVANKYSGAQQFTGSAAKGNANRNKQTTAPNLSSALSIMFRDYTTG